MDRRTRNILIVAGAAIVLAFLIYLFSRAEERYVWNETYRDEGNQPYDLSLFKGVLEKSSENFEVLEGLFSDTTYLEGSGNTMVFVGGYAWIDSLEAGLLKRFVENGNNLLISSVSIGNSIRYFTDCEIDREQKLTQREEADFIRIKNNEGSFRLSFDQYNQPLTYKWMSFNHFSCIEEVGFFEINEANRPNLIEIKASGGSILFHSTPLVFTNYHFRKDSVFNYVNDILGRVDGKTIYYLEPGDSPDTNSGPYIGESPLRFILANPPLKWAWYLTIVLALLFVVNQMRRRQRAIPVTVLPKNQTAAFLDMVYQLFRKEGLHRNIVQSQVKQLHAFLRRKYGLNATKLNDEFYRAASSILKLDKSYIEDFFKQLERYRYNSTLTDSELVQIDQKITEFYLRCP